MKKMGFVLASILFMVGCNFDTKMKYNETQCADEWMHDNDPAIHKNNIKEYLLMKGIETGEITIETIPGSDTLMFCEACNCPSNKMVYIHISAEDKAKALALGFTE